MRLQSLLASAALIGAAAVPATAQRAEIGYPKGSLAFEAIAAEDYAAAEVQLSNEVRIPRDDPARLINHGHVLAKTGRMAEAARAYQQALQADEVELILADGRVMNSREAAERALQSVSVGGPESTDP